MDALDGRVGKLRDGLHCMPIEDGNERRTGSSLARVEEISIARKCQTLSAEGQWSRDLVEHGVEKKKLSDTTGDELRGEAAAVGICGHERNRSRAKDVRAGDDGPIRIENR